MTCIVGFTDKKNNVTWIGADSLGSNGYTQDVESNPKVFRNTTLKNVVMGSTSTFRHIDLLKYSKTLFPEIDKYKIPSKIDVDVEFSEDSFEKLINLYESNRYKSINDILELSQGFFEIMQASKEKHKEKIIQDFYDKRFLQYLSKQEISIEYSDGKNYESLSDDDKKKIDVKGHIEAKKPVNTIVTLSPAFYVRSKLIAREQAFVVNKSKRW